MLLPVFVVERRPMLAPLYQRDIGDQGAVRAIGRPCVPSRKYPLFRIEIAPSEPVKVLPKSVGHAGAARLALHALIGERVMPVTGALLLARTGDLLAGVVARDPSDGGSWSAVAARIEARAVVLGHNHATGRLFRTPEERKAIFGARAAAEALGIALLDHVIVTRDADVWTSATC